MNGLILMFLVAPFAWLFAALAWKRARAARAPRQLSENEKALVALSAWLDRDRDFRSVEWWSRKDGAQSVLLTNPNCGEQFLGLGSTFANAAHDALGRAPE